MNKRSPFQLAALGLGVACAVLLIVLWRRDVPTVTPSVAKSFPVATKGTQPVSAEASTEVMPGKLDPKFVAMIAELERVLFGKGVRRNEAVLTFKDEAALQRFLARAQAAGLSILGRSDRLRSVRVGFQDFGALRGDLLGNANDYDSAAANNIFSVPMPPAREDRASQNEVPFGNDTLAFLGAKGDRSTWGRGTTIAILDTGVGTDATFGSGRVSALDVGYGTTPGTNKTNESGHGTAVGALAAGASADAPGVSPAANLLSIRVTDQNGLSDMFTISQAIVTAVDAGARIINISLGGYSSGSMLDAAIGYATQNGAVIVAAAGNDQAAQLAWPAADTRVVSVGAVDKAEQQVSFSNSGQQLQLSAPGYGVQTAWLDGQRVYVDGTSASAPLVSGAIAALMSQNPNLTPQLAVDLLTSTASDAGAPGADPAYGHGIVNLGTAMNSTNASYVDTAVASHYYDAQSNQMDFTVQNRSGRTVSGMSLGITVAGATTNQTVPSLAPGETYVAKVPVNDIALKATGTLQFTTQLTNPVGVSDQVPANNQRTSVLAAPKK